MGLPAWVTDTFFSTPVPDRTIYVERFFSFGFSPQLNVTVTGDLEALPLAGETVNQASSGVAVQSTLDVNVKVPEPPS